MKYVLNDAELGFVTTVLSQFSIDAVNRQARRHFERLANKFVPPRTRVDLKPLEAFQVKELLRQTMGVGESIIARLQPSPDKVLTEQEEATRAKALERVAFIQEILGKLGDREIQQFMEENRALMESLAK